MKVAVLLAVVLAGIASPTVFAQQPTSTPNFEATPAGEFRVAPSSGPVGTAVTLTGDLDQAVGVIRFRCFYPDASEGLIDYTLGRSTAFSLRHQIPATLSIRQGGGETRPTPLGHCEFLAISCHQLLGRAAAFVVTSGLPATGSGPSDSRPFGAATLALLVSGVLLAGASLAARERLRAA